MRKAHVYDELTDTDEFYFSGRAWWLNLATLFLLFGIQVGTFYVYQRQGNVWSLIGPALCAVAIVFLALAVARRSHPILVLSGNTLEYVDLMSLLMRPKRVSMERVTAASDINGVLHLRFESGDFERIPLRLIDASARSTVVESINRRISNVGESSTA